MKEKLKLKKERKEFKMKNGFLKGMIIGATVGAAMGIAFDPISPKDKKCVKRKLERAMDDMMH